MRTQYGMGAECNSKIKYVQYVDDMYEETHMR